MLLMYLEEAHVATSAEADFIAKPLFQAFLLQFCENLKRWSVAQCTHPVVCHKASNPARREAWFPTDKGDEECILLDDGDDNDGSGTFLVNKVELDLTSSPFATLSPENLDQLWIRLYADLNQSMAERHQTDPQSAANDMAEVDMQTSQSLSEYFGWHSETKGSVVGVLSNFSSLVIAYADYRDGQYEFACTASNDPLDAEEFVWRLLYVLTVSSDELVNHCLSARDEAKKSETAGAYDAINLDDDYLTEHDRHKPLEGNEYKSLKRNSNKAFDEILDDKDFSYPPLKRITVQCTDDVCERLEEEEENSSLEGDAVEEEEEEDDDEDQGQIIQEYSGDEEEDETFDDAAAEDDDEDEVDETEEYQATGKYEFVHNIVLEKLRGYR
jgi:hypothetical protein